MFLWHASGTLYRVLASFLRNRGMEYNEPNTRNKSWKPLTVLIGVSTVLTYFNIAFCIGLIGPTLLDLIQLTHVTWSRMGVLLMERAACTVVGNMVAGCLANINIVYLLLIQAFSHLVVLVSQGILPLCTSEKELIILFTIQGVFLGTNNNLSNLITVGVQGAAAHSWLQALFMAYSGAVLLAPIVATPYLSEAAAKNQSSQSCIHNVTNTSSVSYTPLSSHLHNVTTDIDLRIPYWTSSATCALAIVLLLISALWAKCSHFVVPDAERGVKERPMRKLVIVLASILAMFYFTIDGVTGRFIFSFAVKSKLCLGVKVAGMITTLFGGATLIMRGCCGLVTALKPNIVSPIRLLVANHVALSVALVTILIGRDSSEPAVWVFAFFSGVGVSNGFPSLMALLKSLGASKKVLSILPIGGGVGITVGPLITSYMMSDDVAGPGQGFYSLFAIASHIATFMFGFLMSVIDVSVISERHISKRKNNVSVSYYDGKDSVIVNECIEEGFSIPETPLHEETNNDTVHVT